MPAIANAEVTLDLSEDLVSETIEGLEDFAEEPQGAWKNGWYPAVILEGFQTRKGKTIETGDSVSQKGDSRNLKLCIKVANGKDERTLITSFNYRTSDFTPERLAFIKEARAENKGVKGKWSDSDAQRSSLALASLGGLAKAVGFSPKLAPQGGLIAGIYVGQAVDVYLGVDDKGYNEVRNFAKSGTGGKKQPTPTS